MGSFWSLEKCYNRSAFDDVAKLSQRDLFLLALPRTMNLGFSSSIHWVASEVDRLLTACFCPRRGSRKYHFMWKFHLRLWGNRNNTISLNKDRSLDFFFLCMLNAVFTAKSIDTNSRQPNMEENRNGGKIKINFISFKAVWVLHKQLQWAEKRESKTIWFRWYLETGIIY
jgi:predicted DNA-binding transcriptional regulator AlpA